MPAPPLVPAIAPPVPALDVAPPVPAAPFAPAPDVAPPVPTVGDAPALPAAPVSTPVPSLLTQPAATAKSAGASNRRMVGERGAIVSTVTPATRIGSPVDPDHQIGVVIAKVVMNAAGSER